MKHYDGYKLLHSRDIDGNKPEIFMVESNRSDGKTTYFVKYLVEEFLSSSKKTLFLYRFKYELKECADKIFGGVRPLFFKDHEFSSESKMSGLYTELYIDGQPCGYACSINSSDKLKTMSHLLNDVSYMFFDEFQSESGHYCEDEVNKVISIHSSVARGQGEHVRYLPLIMCSNYVTILNPYYTALKITERLNDSVKFMRGHGFVLHLNFNEEVAKAQTEVSGFNKAFGNNLYVRYLSERSYLNDDGEAIIGTVSLDDYHYVLTVKHEGTVYAIYKHLVTGQYYVTDKGVDKSHPLKITTGIPQGEWRHAEAYFDLLNSLRVYFKSGAFTFRNMLSRTACFCMLRYH